MTGSILQFLTFWAFISLYFGPVGLHFLSFWLFRGQLLGSPPQVAKYGPFAQRPYNGFISAVTGSILKFLAFWAFISVHFGLVGLHFLAFWPSGPSFPCILALWAFISLHFGLVGVHFLVFWPCGPSFPFILAFSGSASRVPPKSCEIWPVCPTSLQWIYQRRDRLHFEVFSFLGLHFCPFWPCGPSFPCILALWAFISLHFGLACRPCGPSFPCILALWAFISLHFGLVGLHFLAFWPCGLSFPCILAFSGSASGVPPISCQKWPVCPTSLQWIYQRRDRLHFAVFNLLGLHFLVFWPCGPSFPFILAFSGSASRVPPTSCEIWPVCPTSLQWIYQRRDRLHFEVFSFLGLHFCPFWPCGPSFPCILALWAFISLHFGIVGLHFLAFWPCGPSFPFILALWAFISLHFGLVGFHFLAFWPCGPSFPCILALWAFISLHFGLVGLHFLAFRLHFAVFSLLGLHFLAFWPWGHSFPCILALCAFISFHFGFFGVSF